MIFPQDVHKVITQTNKIKGENEWRLYVLLTVIGGGFLFFIIDFLLGNLFGAGLGVTILVFLVIALAIGFLVFRFKIFDEDAKKKEYEGQESDSFAKYMWLRKDTHTSTALRGNDVTIFEYVNGSAMCVIEMRFGSNNDEKAYGTRTIYEKLIQIAADNKLESRVISSQENFRNSEEFKEQIAAINRITNAKSARNVTMINDAIIEQSVKLCNVDIIYFMLRTTSNHQRYDLEIALKRIFSVMHGNINAFRSIKFLNPEELMEFYREFYKIAAIDLSMMRTMELTELNEEFDEIVQLLQVKTETGRVFNTRDLNLVSCKETQIKNNAKVTQQVGK